MDLQILSVLTPSSRIKKIYVDKKILIEGQPFVASIKTLGSERVRNKRHRNRGDCGHFAKRRSESQAVSIEIAIE